MPTDPDYLDLDLADHLVLIGINGERLDWYIQQADSKPFKEQVQDDYIMQRDIWMQSFRKGLFVESELPLVVDFVYVLFHLQQANL